MDRNPYGYRVTEYDEDRYGHPSFLVEAAEPSPLAPALILVRRPGGSWDAYQWDGTPWPGWDGPPWTAGVRPDRGGAQVPGAGRARVLQAGVLPGSWRLSAPACEPRTSATAS